MSPYSLIWSRMKEEFLVSMINYLIEILSCWTKKTCVLIEVV